MIVRFAHSDAAGYSQRPALLVQGDACRTDVPQLLFALITTNLARVGPTRIPVRRDSDEGRAMGLRADSVIVLDNIATVQEAFCHRTIGRHPDLAKVDRALHLAFGLEGASNDSAGSSPQGGQQ